MAINQAMTDAGRDHDPVDEEAWREDEVGEAPVATLDLAVGVLGEHDRTHDDHECCDDAPDDHSRTVGLPSKSVNAPFVSAGRGQVHPRPAGLGVRAAMVERYAPGALIGSRLAVPPPREVTSWGTVGSSAASSTGPLPEARVCLP